MNAPPEPVSSRTIPRYRGRPVRHRLRFFRTEPADPGFRSGGLRAVCEAGDYAVTIDGDRPWQDLAKLNRQHAGKP